MTPRIERLRARAQRSYLIAPETLEAPAAAPGDGPLATAAKAYADACRRGPIVIGDDELIVGTPAHLAYGDAPPDPSCFGRQSFTPWGILENDPETGGYFRAGLLSFAGNHTTVDFTAILTMGFTGLLTRIDARLSREVTPEQADFLQALRIVAEGYIDFCRRYGELAESLSHTAAPDRAVELRVIAGACRRVLAEPPRTFREACQALWFAFLFMPDAPGRVDALLAPFYLRDLEDGILTREEARELLSALWIRYFEYLGASLAVSALHHLTLGGLTPAGDDASGELTDLCLEVTAELGLHRPQVGLRWHKGMPIERLRRAVRTWRSKSGGPDLCNDEMLVPALVKLGVAVEDARDYSLSGCQEVIISGKAQMGSVEGFINLPKILRIALGLEPDFLPARPLPTFDDCWTAWEEALALVIDRAHAASLLRDREAARDPLLTTSLVVCDCIEQARGYTQGGARYNFCNWNIIGAANAVDGLMAVKTLVYDNGDATLEALRAALSADWAGFTDLYLRVQRAPRFGNDHETVDALAARMISAHRCPVQAPHAIPRRLLHPRHHRRRRKHARRVRARHRRHPRRPPRWGNLRRQHRRRPGPRYARGDGAAQLGGRLPHHLLPTATTLNVKLDPRTLATEKGVEKIAESDPRAFPHRRPALPGEPGQPRHPPRRPRPPRALPRPDRARGRLQRPVHLPLGRPAGGDRSRARGMGRAGKIAVRIQRW